MLQDQLTNHATVFLRSQCYVNDHHDWVTKVTKQYALSLHQPGQTRDDLGLGDYQRTLNKFTTGTPYLLGVHQMFRKHTWQNKHK